MLDALELSRATGWLALAMLALALCATPVQRVLRAVRRDHPAAAHVPAWRRRLGIGAALLAIVHAIVSLSGYLRDAWPAVVSWPHLRAGLVAACILAALLITSFPSVVRALRIRLWKPLHRLAYVAAAFVLLHLVLSPFAPREAVFAVFGAVGAIGLLRLLPPKRSP